MYVIDNIKLLDTVAGDKSALVSTFYGQTATLIVVDKAFISDFVLRPREPCFLTLTRVFDRSFK